LENASAGAPESVTTRLRKAAEHRSNSVWERLGRPETELGEAPSVIYRRLRLEMLTGFHPSPTRRVVGARAPVGGSRP
jgi:hypothetical protein